MPTRTSDIQSVRFDRRRGWEAKAARRWLKDHGFEPTKRVDTTTTQLRYRIADPEKFDHFAIIRVPKRAIQLVVGYYRR